MNGLSKKKTGNAGKTDMAEIKKATHEDLSKILHLQKLAYLSEANLLNNYSIQPLTQTPEELEQEFSKSIILKIENEDTNEIIGSVRSYEENNRVYIGKLMVHPDYQNRGIGTKLLKTIETYYENKTFELFTSNKSEKNMLLYKKNGYNEYKRKTVSENLELIFMEKVMEGSIPHSVWNNLSETTVMVGLSVK